MNRPHKKKKELVITSNLKYEITDIAHAQYHFLHRIRALRDIGMHVKAGDLGGFVESESNLATETSDPAWIFNDAIVCNTAYVDQGAVLMDSAVACDLAYVSHGAVLSGNARAEDDAYIRGAALTEHARASGHSMVLRTSDGDAGPSLSGQCTVYGKVQGNVQVLGSSVIISGEEVYNDTPDTLVIRDGIRSILRDPSRDELTSSVEQPAPEKPKKKEMSR